MPDTHPLNEINFLAGLQGKTALITGGGGGIGLACAKHLIAAGATVVSVDRSETALSAARSQLGDRYHGVCGDACDPATIERCVGFLRDNGLLPSILINNAGGFVSDTPLIETSIEKFQKALSLNLVSTLMWTQACWRHFFKEHSGVVLNMASVGGAEIGAPAGGYSIAKAGVIHMTKTLAAELGPRVRVNAIAPGIVRTDLTQDLVSNAELRIAQMFPARRIGEPSDIANTAMFLISDAASWITGAVVTVDGGALVRHAQISQSAGAD